ncbi:hypothetical protein ZHAS_00016346 [Anopheles sinensis]|uniref:Uncharacterized protein n=1 Tax=Anopheles sinensis TaxID=74873 RepID=A0A084WDD2_ANOSI|nr:hypothetical protein ZHAS_00016346 [Anopheles sinensis]
MNELAWWDASVAAKRANVLRTGSSPIRLHDCHPHPRCSRWYKLKVLRLVLFVAACVLFGVSLDFIFHSPASKAGDVRSFLLAHELVGVNQDGTEEHGVRAAVVVDQFYPGSSSSSSSRHLEAPLGD